MTNNKRNDSEKEFEPSIINLNDELNIIDNGVTERVDAYQNLQAEDTVTLFWGDEWNIEEAEKKKMDCNRPNDVKQY
ncbi:hypothetical protein [Bacillus pseudomycoides]|uniref:Uncharacterized protein n=1 Tax=Bacillus pseudomycoides TaxID=64104 RepID=A0A2C3XCA9_9BACI|nr:hypothetical protein [Bacillus pseudomycoides]PDY46135.1 hypothetical protein CON79_16765 [Bacillus pseudomycoides]PED71206.1 hypothetical protein CON97_15110 [Bacillus pseudomycoides]PEI46206.1 hypothetical protein CN620_01845 [Bacillus pseudomycoides]PEJ70840.1 hypothetical protein CN680_23745 [Bacillus pseudomycoides]PEM16751.1 hypothetical protein CN628_12765 [Bacillus pseudomycoides]